MRVLNANKFFYLRGGSEAVFFLTRELLLARGHDVVDFAMRDPHNADSPYSEYFTVPRAYGGANHDLRARIRDAAASVYSTSARGRIRDLVKATRPDVAHLHNVYYQLTLSIVDELHAQDVPIVMTLHDPQIACPAHILYRGAGECRDCTHGSFAPAVRHRCVKGSAAASLLGAVEGTVNRWGRKYQKISRFVCPSAFMADVAREAGIDTSRVDVIPNFLPDDEFRDPVDALATDPRLLYAGQLEEHKGLCDLLAAFARTPPGVGTLVIAGGGSLEGLVREAATRDARISFLGPISRDAVARELRRSRAAVLPARWPENNPMSVLEARAAGIPVITSDTGGLREIVVDNVDGVQFRAGDTNALAAALQLLCTDRQLAQRIAQAGHDRAARENAAERHYQALIGSYAAARSSTQVH